MNRMKLQIALDYLMVFVFVLFIFILVFVSIAKQRALLSEQQGYAQLQLVAQTVASELSSASQAGNGYNGTLLLPPQLSVVGYNLSITTRGMVIASSNIIGQNIQATAFSLVHNVVSNTLYLSNNKLYYAIPAASSTGYLTLQNSFGTICVDYSCPLTSYQPSRITLFDQVAGTFQMNGYNNNAMLYYPPTTSPAESISFWMKETAPPTSSSLQYIVDQGNFLSSTSYPQVDWIGLLDGAVIGGTSATSFCGTPTINQNQWYFITYTLSSTTLNVYVNGNPNLGCFQSITPIQPNDIIIGESASGFQSTSFNGSIADLQIYNVTLSPAQAFNLYHEGITGNPIAPANIVGWYTFSGNGNDYSGNGRNLVVNGQSTYPSAAQVFASVTNSSGLPLSGVPVGFISNLGYATGQVTTNDTDSNGIAYTVLSQFSSGGYANVRATAFSGNLSTTQNVIAWWPLSDGQGFVAHDISGMSTAQNNFNGKINSAYWSLPNYVAQFDGFSSAIQIPNAQILQSGGSTPSITISAWVNFTTPPPHRQDYFAISKSGGWYFGGCTKFLYACYYNPSLGTLETSSTLLNPGVWYLITQTLGPSSGGRENLYINGIDVMKSASGTVTQTGGIKIGRSDALGSPTFLSGSVSDLQVYQTTFTPSQVSTLYSYGLGAPPLAGAGIIGWWPLNGDAKDYSGNSNNGIIYGNLEMVPLNSQSIQGTQFLSGSFNPGSYVFIGNSNILLPNTNVVVSAWIKTSSSQATEIIFSGLDSLLPARGYDLYLSSGIPSFTVATGSSASCTVQSFASTPINDNQWHFIAGAYNGTYASIYVDGVVQNVQSCNFVPKPIDYAPIGSDNAIIGGSSPYNPTYGFTGYISNAQLYNSSISPPGISKLYSEGVSGFPLQASGLAGWWPLDGDANDYSTYGDEGSFINGVYYEQSTLKSFIAPSLNGAGLQFANGLYANVIVPGNLFINGPFTVSAWINPGTIPSPEVVVGKLDSFNLSIDSTGNREGDFFAYINGEMQGPAKTPFSLNPGQWYMLTGVYNGTYNGITVFLNGIPVNVMPVSGATPGTIAANNNPTVMGVSPVLPYNQYYYNGTIADVQVYNTPLTAAQVYQLYNVGIPQSSSISVPLGGDT